MKPSADCVIQPLVSAVAKHHVVPREYLLCCKFGKNSLPDSRLCWIRDVTNHLKGVDLFISIVIGIVLHLLLQLDVPSLMVDYVNGFVNHVGDSAFLSIVIEREERFDVQDLVRVLCKM